jgi:hypothetical protein
MLRLAQAMVPTAEAQAELAKACLDVHVWREQAAKVLQLRMKQLHEADRERGTGEYKSRLEDLRKTCLQLFRQPADAAEWMQECIRKWFQRALIPIGEVRCKSSTHSRRSRVDRCLTCQDMPHLGMHSMHDAYITYIEPRNSSGMS